MNVEVVNKSMVLHFPHFIEHNDKTEIVSTLSGVGAWRAAPNETEQWCKGSLLA